MNDEEGMTYQVRHRTLGVFQGVEDTPEGVGVCYHPASKSPEMGFCEFQTLDAAKEFVDWILSIDTLEYDMADLMIETFNKGGSDRIQRFGVELITLEHWTRLLDKLNG